MSVNTPYPALALRAIEATAVPRLLRDHTAVALERLARGGGATRWFFIGGPEQLLVLADRLSPGSSLSFYFDDRIAFSPFGSEVAEEILRIAAEEGDAVVGRLSPGELEIAMEFVSGPSDLDDVSRSLGADERVFYGRFPARDSDSVHAVTLDLPDADGVVRRHPH
jgi:hypothetical protein